MSKFKVTAKPFREHNFTGVELCVTNAITGERAETVLLTEDEHELSATIEKLKNALSDR